MWMSSETAYGEVPFVPLLKSVTGTSQISWCVLVGLSFLLPALPLPIAQGTIQLQLPQCVCLCMYTFALASVSSCVEMVGERFGLAGVEVSLELSFVSTRGTQFTTISILSNTFVASTWGKGGRERREFYGFSEQRSNCTSKPLGSGSNLRAVPLITTFSENPENIPAHFSPYTHTLEHHINFNNFLDSISPSEGRRHVDSQLYFPALSLAADWSSPLQLH